MPHPIPNVPMSSRYRLLTVWLLASSLFLAVLFLSQSSTGSRFLAWNREGAVIDEPKPNAVIVILVAPSRIAQAMVALRNIEDRFNHRLKYPYVLLTEANITEAIQDKANWITEGRVTFATLPPEMWGPPEYLDDDKMEESVKTIGFSRGYRSMCRFYSGFFWRHPAVMPYDWIWRLDTDIEFHCDVPYDPFVRMRSANALYGFVQISDDGLWVQPSLAANVSAFMASHSDLIPPNANHAFSWHNTEKVLSGNGGNKDWTLGTFYNNWEISHRSLWTSDLYTSFFEYLDQAGGFFYERWGDAPVHSLGVSMSLRPDQVMQFEDMGYEHHHWPYDCPSLDRCTCVRDSVKEKFNSHGDRWFNAGTRT